MIDSLNTAFGKMSDAKKQQAIKKVCQMAGGETHASSEHPNSVHCGLLQPHSHGLASDKRNVLAHTRLRNSRTTSVPLYFTRTHALTPRQTVSSRSTSRPRTRRRPGSSTSRRKEQSQRERQRSPVSSYLIGWLSTVVYLETQVVVNDY